MARDMANNLSSRFPAAAELQEARDSPQAYADVCLRVFVTSPDGGVIALRAKR